MGKRSSFARIARDFYPTPREAVRPLLAHLTPGTGFIEPCCGDGALIAHLEAAGHACVGASDLEPQGPFARADALTTTWSTGPIYGGSWVFITNPPWKRALLHGLIVRLSDQAPAWLLFDADWAHTVQAGPFLKRLRKVVAVGRVKWIPGSKHTGKDNCAWHLFTRPQAHTPAAFYGRGQRVEIQRQLRRAA